MKNTFRFALTLLVTTSLTAMAYAANINDETIPDTGPVPLVKVESGKKNREDEKNPVSKPMSAWLVGPSLASQFDAKEHPDDVGCLMVTEFDNGMIIGLHARAAGIVGMTVDTKKPTLSAGAKLRTAINLGADSYALNAVASDASTLMMDLSEAGGGKKVAERLTSLGSFRLMIDEKPYYFATTGFTDGLARLQACMGGMMAVSVPVVGPGVMEGKISHIPTVEAKRVTSSGTNTPLALAIPQLIPVGYKFRMDGIDPMTPVNWQAGNDWMEVMRMALAPHNLKMAIREDMIFISKRTGESDPVVDSDQKMEREVAELNAIPPIMDDVVAAATSTPAPATMPDIQGVWGGAQGENLGSVLEAWGLMAGVKVKTDLVGDLRLPRDVRYEGSFSDAVQKLLSQFSGRNRPVGEYRGTTLSSALNSPPPVAVLQEAAPKSVAPAQEPKKELPKSDWKPKDPAELAAMAKEAQARWAPLKQMAVIPDPPEAPKLALPDTKIVTGDTPKEKIPNTKTMGTWQALQGTSLQDIVREWGKDADVNVVWNTKDTFPLPETIKSKGSFEDAIGELLKQYKGQSLQPSVQLNLDPDTGEKALIIQTKAR